MRPPTAVGWSPTGFAPTGANPGYWSWGWCNVDETLADEMYDTIRKSGGCHVPPDFDLMGEWMRIRPGIRSKLWTRRSHAMRIDEWAERFGVDSGTLLAELARARTLRERRDEQMHIERLMRDVYSEEE